MLPPLSDWLQAAVYLVAFLILYRLLGWPGQAASRGVGRRALFALLGTLALAAVLTGRPAPPPEPGDPGRAFQQQLQAAMRVRLAFGPPVLHRWETSEEVLESAVEGYREAVRHTPGSPAYRRELAALHLAREELAEARQVVDERLAALAEAEPELAERETAFWELALAPEPTEEQAREVERLAPELLPEFFADIVLEATFRRAGLEEAAEARREALREEALGYLLRIGARAVLPWLLLVIAGVVLTFVALGLFASGVLRRAPRSWTDVAPVLWEGFILYMFFWSAPAWLWVIAPGEPAAEAPPGTLVALNLGMQAVVLLLVGYAAARLRAVGRGLAELGLTLRAFWKNVGWGVLAYPVVLVNVLWISLLGQRLWEHFFPGPLPYHPVSLLVAAADDPWLLLGLFLMAVVGAAVVEEIFFRGALYGALRRRSGPWLAAAVSSAIFAALHPQVVGVFLLGMALAFLYEWRGSLVPCIVLHALQNGLALWFTLTLAGG